MTPSLIIFCLIGIILCVILNVFTEYRRFVMTGAEHLDYWNQPISAYMDGPASVFEDLGFLVLMAVLLVVGYFVPGNFWWHAGLFTAAGAVPVTIATKRLQIGASPSQYATLEWWHLRAAGIAFLSITVAEIAGSHPYTFLFWLAWSAPGVAAIFNRLATKKTAIEEKLYFIINVLWMEFFLLALYKKLKYG